jgi:hypothetical protein
VKPIVWHLALFEEQVKGWLGGTVRDLRDHGFEVCPILTREQDYVTVVGVHPFAGVVTAGFHRDGTTAGSATIHPYDEPIRVVTIAQARSWAKEQESQ